MNNSRKSPAKPKHCEERKAFYRSDTRQPKLLDQVRNRIRCKHYSIRTEQAYIEWIKKFIFYHGKRHPAEMGKKEISKGIKSPGDMLFS
ncbi:MAG: phage integrase N-terminal SAM-like domain-containing protein [Deltaproteobacteria bacterium]|nr:phage integrase N-terminal SAM-like domain-containing protein [Deltaproteobacteria bacterium]